MTGNEYGNSVCFTRIVLSAPNLRTKCIFVFLSLWRIIYFVLTPSFFNAFICSLPKLSSPVLVISPDFNPRRWAQTDAFVLFPTAGITTMSLNGSLSPNFIHNSFSCVGLSVSTHALSSSIKLSVTISPMPIKSNFPKLNICNIISDFLL